MSEENKSMAWGMSVVRRCVKKNDDGESIFEIQDMNYLEGDKNREKLFLCMVGGVLCDLQNKITEMRDEEVAEKIKPFDKCHVALTESNTNKK